MALMRRPPRTRDRCGRGRGRPAGRSVAPSGKRTTAPSSRSSSRWSRKRRASTDIRSWSSSCSRRLAWGSAMTPGSRPSPVSCTSAAVTPCGAKSWKRTTLSVSAIAPADQATTVCSRTDRHVEETERPEQGAHVAAGDDDSLALVEDRADLALVPPHGAALVRRREWHGSSGTARRAARHTTGRRRARPRSRPPRRRDPTACSDVRWATACTASIAACSRMP